jgi:hypothetical protein
MPAVAVEVDLMDKQVRGLAELGAVEMEVQMVLRLMELSILVAAAEEELG